MTRWNTGRMTDRSGKAVIAVTLLALLLVAAVPVALLAGLIIMALGHVLVGLAVFGGSVLVAVVGVTIAGMSGVRHLRKLILRSGFPIVQPDGTQYTDVPEPRNSDHANVVQLDRSDYTEIR